MSENQNVFTIIEAINGVKDGEQIRWTFENEMTPAKRQSLLYLATHSQPENQLVHVSRLPVLILSSDVQAGDEIIATFCPYTDKLCTVQGRVWESSGGALLLGDHTVVDGYGRLGVTVVPDSITLVDRPGVKHESFALFERVMVDGNPQHVGTIVMTSRPGTGLTYKVKIDATAMPVWCAPERLSPPPTDAEIVSSLTAHEWVTFVYSGKLRGPYAVFTDEVNNPYLRAGNYILVSLSGYVDPSITDIRRCPAPKTTYRDPA